MNYSIIVSTLDLYVVIPPDIPWHNPIFIRNCTTIYFNILAYLDLGQKTFFMIFEMKVPFLEYKLEPPFFQTVVEEGS